MDIKSLVPMSLRYRIIELRGRGIYSEYADECECIFIHIPKAAGTSIARTLFDKGSRHVSYIEYERANRRKFERYYKFSFVRNPWDRLVSAYFFLKKSGLNEQDRAWAEINLAEFSDFDSFVRGWVNERNIQTWVHFWPQHYFICDKDDTIMMDFVGRMENLDIDFSYVAANIGCKRKLEKVNVGNRRHYSTYYDKDTREIVREVYHKDICLFNYEYESSTREI